MPMSDADFDAAVARAAKLLRASKAPVIAGLGADVAGIVAAFRLAEKLGAAIDHAGADWALRDQAVLQDIGLMLASPGEVFGRADVILLVGDRPFDAWPELPDLLFRARENGDSSVSGRKIVALTSRAAGLQSGNVATRLRADAAAIPTILATLRARTNRRPVARDFDRAAEIDAAAGILQAAKFGVALWSPEEIEALTIEMLVGLVKDLNATTRWSGLSVASDMSATAAAMASGWMTGLPLRVSFARARPAHDPWQYDSRRRVESREADVVVWISAFGEALPEWLSGVPTILLADAVGPAKGRAGVSLTVGRPGRDHDGVLFDRTTGTLVEVVAQSRSTLPSVADALNRIASAVSPP
jgi:formylmethanofuran dehydrogenase subunit B